MMKKWFVPSRVDFETVLEYAVAFRANNGIRLKAKSKSQALKFIDEIFDCRIALNAARYDGAISTDIFARLNAILTDMECDVRNWLEVMID